MRTRGNPESGALTAGLLRKLAMTNKQGDVVKLVYTLASGASGSNAMRVQISPSPPIIN